MADQGTLPRLCDGYIRHPCLIGTLYGIVPVVLWFGVTLAAVPFREVYLLRFVTSLVVAGVAGAGLNRFGLSLWLFKHRSAAGPAGPCDGALIGAAIGAGIALLPPLTSLIGTRHVEEAKTFIICSWLASTAVAMLIGAVLGAAGRKHVDRSAPAEGK
jgi:hypothetical protein